MQNIRANFCYEIDFIDVLLDRIGGFLISHLDKCGFHGELLPYSTISIGKLIFRAEPPIYENTIVWLNIIVGTNVDMMIATF